MTAWPSNSDSFTRLRDNSWKAFTQGPGTRTLAQPRAMGNICGTPSDGLPVSEYARLYARSTPAKELRELDVKIILWDMDGGAPPPPLVPVVHTQRSWPQA